MKKLILFISLLAIPMVLSAQSKGVQNLYDTYQGKGVVTMQLNTGSIDIGSAFDLDMGDVTVDKVLLMSSSKDKPTAAANFRKSVDALVADGAYTKFMDINDGSDGKVQIYTLSSGKKTNEMVLVIDSTDGSLVLISVSGENLDPQKMVKSKK